MKPSTPPWLLRSFVEAVRNTHASASAQHAQQVGEELLNRWNAATRTFHNSQHLVNMLSRIDELSALTQDPDTLRIAAWFWGALGTQASEFAAEQSNKTISHCHRYVTETLGELGFSDDKKQRVCELIAHLFEHHAPAGDLDATALVDASMAVFASMPQEYKRYRQTVRDEYPHLSDLQYQIRRRRYIRALLKRSMIFRSPIASQWEASARQNLEAELVNLDASIAKLDPSIGDDSALDRPDPHENEPVSQTFVVKRSHDRNAPNKSSEPTDEATISRERPVSTSSTRHAAHSGETDTVAETAAQRAANSTPKDSPVSSDSGDKASPDADIRSLSSGTSASSGRSEGGSSLEAEPDFLEPIKTAPTRRLSAKEYARETGLLRKSERSLPDGNDNQDTGAGDKTGEQRRSDE